MRVYLGKVRTHAPGTMTATHATVARLTTRTGNVRHKFYMDKYISSPDLFNNLHMKTINCCGTVMLIEKGMPENF